MSYKYFAEQMAGETDFCTISSGYQVSLTHPHPNAAWIWVVRGIETWGGVDREERVLADGKGKTCVHALKNAEKKAKELRAKQAEANLRYAQHPSNKAFESHPIMVAASKAKAEQLAAGVGYLTAHETYMKATGIYYWRTTTQFVPGMGPGHYGDDE